MGCVVKPTVISIMVLLFMCFVLGGGVGGFFICYGVLDMGYFVESFVYYW